MRITNQILTGNFLYGLNSLQNQMETYLNQLSTGKAINVPSDNPVGAGNILHYNDILSQTKSYLANVADGISWLQTTDGALQNATNVLQTASQLAVQAGSGTMNKSDLADILQQVNSLIGQMVQVGNTAYGSQYVFGGYKDTTPAFTAVTGANGLVTQVTYNGDTGAVQREVGPATLVTVNLTGGQVFGQGSTGGTAPNVTATGSGVLGDLLQFSADLQNAAAGATVNFATDQANIQNDLNNLTTASATSGSRLQQFQAAQNNLQAFQVSVTDLLAQVQDVNMAKAMTNFSSLRNAYQAALNAGANLLPPDLFNFLK